MATPLTVDRLRSALSAEGVNFREYRSWHTHNRNDFGPWGGVNGVVIHHTAGRDSLELVYEGRSDLPGPLAQAHISKSGVVSLTGHGRANHAGTFARNAHNAVVNESSTHPRPDASEPIDGNAHYYGAEVENLGDGKDWYPAEQYDQTVRWAAAICRAHGWTANSVIGHKEGTTRKIDPKGPVGSKTGPAFDMDRFRADVQKRLDAGTPPKPSVVYVDLSHVQDAARRDPGLAQGGTTHKTDVLRVERALDAEGLLAAQWVDGSFGTKTREAYKRWQARCGYSGGNANGIPGRSSLTRLGDRHGWKVRA
jgi:hypothetical protein